MIQTVDLKWPVKTIAAIVLHLLCTTARSQTYIVIDSPFIKGTTVVIPGKEYRRSGWHNYFWGDHYRKEWSTAFRAENFHLDTADG